MLISRSPDQPDRQGLTWDQRWEGPDAGLIAAWERGREKATEDRQLAAAAQAGELVVLPWKGGVTTTLKGKKYGTLLYLAMWQGLRGEALNIDDSREYSVVCSKTSTTVVYTADSVKFRVP